MASHHPLTQPTFSPAIQPQAFPQIRASSPDITEDSSADRIDLKAEVERAGRFGHHFKYISPIAGVPPLQTKPQSIPQDHLDHSEEAPEETSVQRKLSTAASGSAAQSGSAGSSGSNPTQTQALTPSSHDLSLQAQRERAERFGHQFSRIPVLSQPSPAVQAHPLSIWIQRLCTDCQEGEQREPEIQMRPEISRSIQPLTLQGDWLQSQATAPGGPNPNCLQILGEILSFLFGQLTNSIGGTTLNGVNLHRGLIERWQDLNTDTHNLYQNHRTRAQAHPQYGSWEGHVDQYRTQRQGLRQRISQWVRNNCDDPNNMGGMPEGAQNVIQNARRWVTIDPPNQPSASAQNAAPFQLPDLIPAFALSAAAAIGVSRSAMWKKFWQVVITRFGVRGGAAAALSAADGPLPVGELLSLGIAVWTLWDIYRLWDSLWQEAATQI